jgi:GNAT superfamily N-acetyltransferase
VTAPAPQRFELRPAVASDAEHLARAVTDAFEGYRSIAPLGWAPPPHSTQLQRVRGLLARDDFWCLVAERRDEVVGHMGFIPVTAAVRAIADPALAHVVALFVRPDCWGAGVATALHAAGVDAARARGFEAMRLFTPARQARARRFYEREGWAQAGEPFHEPDLGLSLVEYRRPVPPST